VNAFVQDFPELATAEGQDRLRSILAGVNDAERPVREIEQ